MFEEERSKLFQEQTSKREKQFSVSDVEASVQMREELRQVDDGEVEGESRQEKSSERGEKARDRRERERERESKRERNEPQLRSCSGSLSL